MVIGLAVWKVRSPHPYNIENFCIEKNCASSPACVFDLPTVTNLPACALFLVTQKLERSPFLRSCLPVQFLRPLGIARAHRYRCLDGERLTPRERTLKLLGCPSVAALDGTYVNVPSSWQG
jgi:hypothetical protein